ncbi:ABC transporter, permease/ATP-binding protein [Lysobacter antibioticus]|uniref:Putative aBC transporter, permease/ATP-binding protein n=1 Tax=Lysobacter antibioticus TaxID=84531 RepID=A0A0S2DW52_LYSAN|nr:ABC transporter, permease/ATP-binding protein [Lysobacter antibioticus]ALN79553.1 putative aBC transporter, permease/ATP-binding protein [Lysobacter antibioticus]
MLFFDEATSHLDIAGESVVNDSIAALAITRVIVAHRPEKIASADRALVLDTGCLEEVRAVDPNHRRQLPVAG